MAFLKGLDVDKLKSSVKDGVKKAQDGLASIDVVKSAMKKPADEEEASTVCEFVSLLWYLALIDGAVSAAERARIGELARTLDGEPGDAVEEIEGACSSRIETAACEYGRLNACKIEAEKIIDRTIFSAIEAKLVCWNLLAVGVSDGLSDEERDYVRFVAVRLRVNEAVYEELKSYASAVVELARARDELRASNRSYAEIEPLVLELDKRERMIVEAAQALVTDR